MEPVRSALPVIVRGVLRSTLATALAIQAIPASAHAQQFGLAVGWAQSNLSTDQGGGFVTNPHYGRDAWWGGLVFIQPVRRWLDFQGEALYATKGFGEPSDPAQKLTYLEMPLLARFGPPVQDSSRIRPFVTLGPGVGFLLGCSLNGYNCTGAFSLGDAYHMRPLELSGQFGVGVELRSAGGQSTLLEARVERSLLDIDYARGNTLSHSFVLRVARMF